jgi:hypothetical protein
MSSSIQRLVVVRCDLEKLIFECQFD